MRRLNIAGTTDLDGVGERRKPAEQRAYLVRAGVVALFLIVYVTPFSPHSPMLGLDPSWGQVLQHAWNHNLQFGEEIVFTYGPLGALHVNHFQEALFYPRVLFHVLLLALSAIITARWLVRAPMSVVVAIGMTIAFTAHIESLFYFFPALLPLLAFQPLPAGRGHRAMLAAVVAVCALLSLVKFSFVPASLVAMLLIDGFRLTQRRVPLFTPAYAAMVVVGWLASGQSLVNLYPFIRGSLAVSRGYSEAMQREFGVTDWLWYLVAGSCLLVLLTGMTWARRGWATLLAVLCLAATGWMVSKAGFVRGHILIATSSLAAFVWLYGVVAWGQARGYVLRAAVVLLLLPGVSLHVRSLYLYRQGAWQAVSDMVQHLPDRLRIGWETLNGAQFARLQEDYTEASEWLQARFPLDTLAADTTVDVYPWEQSAALANGLHYRPRPVFQSYTVYTHDLIEKNLAFLRGERAAEVILFDNWPIDGRFPAMEEGASWPEILSRYDLADAVSNFLVFRKRPSPRGYQTALLGEHPLTLAQPLELPLEAPLLWAQLDIEKTWFGRLANLFYKSPILQLEVEYQGGAQERFRILPGVTSSGFMLSPVVKSRADFATIAFGQPQQLRHRVERVAVVGDALAARAYRQPFRLRLSELSFEEALAAGYSEETSAELTKLQTFNALIRQATYTIEAPALRGDTGNLSLSAHAPMRLPLEPPAAESITVGFGLYDGAWQTGATEGVCFRLFGDDIPFWEQCLTPLEVEADRGEQQAIITFPSPRPTQIVLETAPVASSNWAWSYWSEVRFD